MPSNRFAFLRDAVRNHPVVVATTAATAGVLLGGFVVVQVFAPPKPHAETAGTAQAAATVKAEPKTSAETTGSAPSGETVASKECDQQAWPHLTGVCMEEYRNKNRSPRVVSTDKLEKPTVEVSPPASEKNPDSRPPPLGLRPWRSRRHSLRRRRSRPPALRRRLPIRPL